MFLLITDHQGISLNLAKKIVLHTQENFVLIGVIMNVYFTVIKRTLVKVRRITDEKKTKLENLTSNLQAQWYFLSHTHLCYTRLWKVFLRIFTLIYWQHFHYIKSLKYIMEQTLKAVDSNYKLHYLISEKIRTCHLNNIAALQIHFLSYCKMI